MSKETLTKEQKKWQVRDDLYVLERAQEVMSDKNRINAAKAEATSVIKEKQQLLDSLKKVAITKTAPATTKTAPATTKKTQVKNTSNKRR